MEQQESRQEELTSQFMAALDDHLLDVLHGRTEKMMEIKEMAAQLHVHPTHLSNTVRLVTGESACSFYENKILDIAKHLLQTTPKSISEIAYMLTYDPSNFSKFFKAYTSKTPKQYRNEFLIRGNAQNNL